MGGSATVPALRLGDGAAVDSVDYKTVMEQYYTAINGAMASNDRLAAIQHIKARDSARRAFLRKWALTNRLTRSNEHLAEPRCE
jgi:hypothetical protein